MWSLVLFKLRAPLMPIAIGNNDMLERSSKACSDVSAIDFLLFHFSLHRGDWVRVYIPAKQTTPMHSAV